MAYEAAPDRYDDGIGMHYRATGGSGLKLPALSLGLWQNFGTDRPEETHRAILRRALDRGVTHFDLDNNHGPPYGRAEENFGCYLAEDFKPYRDELIISTKAGWDMWPSPYGQGGGSRKYVLASLDCCEVHRRIDDAWVFRPLGTYANKHGRALGDSLAGGTLSFAGMVVTSITRFSFGEVHIEVARTGLSRAEAEAEGHDEVALVTEGTTASGCMPEAEPIALWVMADRTTRLLLGVQVVGGRGAGSASTRPQRL